MLRALIRMALATRVTDTLQELGLEVSDIDLERFAGDNWAAEVPRALEESEI